MIDLNSIILHSSVGMDLSEIIQENSTSEPLSEVQEDLKDQESTIDPDSFILLLADILSHITNKDEKNNDKNAMEAITPSDQKEKRQESILLNTPVDTQKPEILMMDAKQPEALLKNNVALAWINSEQFLPPQSEAIETRDDIPFLANEELLSPEHKEVADELIKIAEQLEKNKTINLANTPVSNDDPSDKLAQGTLSDLKTNAEQITTEMQPVIPELLREPQKDNLSEFVSAPEQSNEQITPQLSAAINNPHTLSDNTLPKKLDIPIDLRDSQWADKFSEHVTWLGQQGIKTALIKIHPEDLGPLEISIKVVKDSASVNIVSHSSQVRDIVDQALPKLREMMADQGLNLSEVHVGTDDGSREFTQQNNDRSEAFMAQTEDEVQLMPLSNKKPPKGLIDYFA